jgi:autotransporter translocation and assembly factor TamB
VSAGRYVTQDLFLSYESQLGAESGTRIGAEYSINRRLKLKGSGSDRGESALDILWRLDY